MEKECFKGSGVSCNKENDRYAGDLRVLRTAKSGMTAHLMGFTLIELLVVVLIIGILAAVAVPQYQKAVEKSKAAQGMMFVKAFNQAAPVYYLNNGIPATDIEQLDVGLSQAQKEEFLCTDIARECNKKEWGVALYGSNVEDYGVVVWRTSGKYKGAGFAMYYILSEHGKELGYNVNELYCLERASGPNQISAERGFYCQKLFGGKEAGLVHNSYEFKI